MAFRSNNDMLAQLTDKAANGLSDANNSIVYRVAEIERHLHNRERWFGISADQSGNDWALADTLNPFVVTSGDNTWGGVAKIAGTSDTPAIDANTRFDPHRFIITTVSVDTMWKLQFIYGSGTSGDAITAGQYTEIYVGYDSANPNVHPRTPWHIMFPRLNCGSDQVWCRGWNATNLATISFFIGWHEYDG